LLQSEKCRLNLLDSTFFSKDSGTPPFVFGICRAGGFVCAGRLYLKVNWNRGGEAARPFGASIPLTMGVRMFNSRSFWRRLGERLNFGRASKARRGRRTNAVQRAVMETLEPRQLMSGSALSGYSVYLIHVGMEQPVNSSVHLSDFDAPLHVTVRDKWAFVYSDSWQDATATLFSTSATNPAFDETADGVNSTDSGLTSRWQPLSALSPGGVPGTANRFFAIGTLAQIDATATNHNLQNDLHNISISDDQPMIAFGDVGYGYGSYGDYDDIFWTVDAWQIDNFCAVCGSKVNPGSGVPSSTVTDGIDPQGFTRVWDSGSNGEDSGTQFLSEHFSSLTGNSGEMSADDGEFVPVLSSTPAENGTAPKYLEYVSAGLRVLWIDPNLTYESTLPGDQSQLVLNCTTGQFTLTDADGQTFAFSNTFG